MKRALVFAGGGAKGAYEFGAWKAFRDMEMDFEILTGTSIGAINAALYVQGDFEAAKIIWTELNMENVMVNGINIDTNLKTLIEQRKNLIPFLKSYINYKGADISPFINTMSKYQNDKKFFDSDIDFGLVTVKFPSMTPVEILKRDIKFGDLGRWILASCSCFPVFPLCEIEGQNYIDGGYYDNLPIATAFRMEADSVVAIDMNYEGTHPAYMNHPLVKYIKPSVDLGSFLRFDRVAIERMINLGYNDTRKAFGHYYGKRYTFYLPDMERIAVYAQAFLRDITYYELSGEFSLGSLFSRPLINAQCTEIISEGVGMHKLDTSEYFLLALEKTMDLFGFDYEFVYSLNDVFERLIRESAEIIDANSDRQTCVRQLAQMLKSRSEKRFFGKRLFENDYELMVAVAVLEGIRNSK